MRTIYTLAIGLAVAGCATVATTVGFPAADADDDDVLSTQEFHKFFDDVDAYERFDDNDDEALSRGEYNEAVDDGYETDAHFKGFDTDGNGSLSRDEFINGWYGMFDTDKSATLTRGEFENAIEALEPEL